MTAAQPQVQVQQSSERPRSCCRRSSTSSTSTSSTSSTVSFDTVEIRGYYITLGDNPSCSRGPPISLDWKYEQELVMKVEEYEQHHTATSRRRSKEQMIVPAVVREEMIRTNTDYTRSEIQDTVQEIQKIQKSRQKNATHSVRRQRNEELLESITKRILTRRNSLMMVPSEEKKTNQPARIDDDTTLSSTTSNRRPSLGSRIVRSIQISSTCRGKQ